MELIFNDYRFYLIILMIVIVFWRFGSNKSKNDIKWKTLGANLQWDQPDESLNKIYDYVVEFSDNSISWYQSRRSPKRILGVWLRLSALFATTLAGLVPLSNQLGLGTIPPVWSTVLIALAGIFVSIDSLMGNTSGWVRYMLAQQKVERLRDAFLLDWNSQKLAKTKPQDMLENAKIFLLAVGKVIDDETQEWATEFQNAIKEMEKVRKTEAEMARTGAIEISVKNPETVTSWVLEIDGSQRGQTTGRNLAVTDVMIGIRKLKIYGKDPQGKILSDEKTVKVEGGLPVTKELEFK
jgi:hypothetical protein